jgi:hypothetical protein
MKDTKQYNDVGNKMINNLYQMQHFQKPTYNTKFVSQNCYENKKRKELKGKIKSFD